MTSETEKKISPRAYSEPCGCGSPAGEVCPHTPSRCKHLFLYFLPNNLTANGPYLEVPPLMRAGELSRLERECELCGFKERAEIGWKLLRSAFGSRSHDQ